MALERWEKKMHTAEEWISLPSLDTRSQALEQHRQESCAGMLDSDALRQFVRIGLAHQRRLKTTLHLVFPHANTVC